MNKTPQQQLQRKCLACGIEKPLAAFLQISGAQGTNYGSICSACRSESAKKQKITLTDEDETGGGSSGVQIDATERIHTDIKQKSEEKKTNLTYKEELEKKDKIALDKTERTDQKQKEERKHRELIEAKKKEGFYKKPSTSETTTPTGTDQLQDAFNLEKALEQEGRLSGIDTSQMFVDSQFGELKYQSVIFKQFKDWLGEGANFRVMERILNKKNNQAKTDKKPADPFIEYEKKNYKPSSKR